MRMWRKIINFSSRVKDWQIVGMSWRVSIIPVENRVPVREIPRPNGLGKLFIAGVLLLLSAYPGDVDAGSVKDEGVFTAYHANGVIESIGHYKDGLKHGEFYEYSEQGYLQWIGFYKKGVRHGEFRQFNAGGELVWVRIYRDGELEKSEKRWLGAGETAQQWSFDEGLPDGVSRSKNLARDWDYGQAPCDGVVKAMEYDGRGRLILAKRYQDESLIDIQLVEQGGCEMTYSKGSIEG